MQNFGMTNKKYYGVLWYFLEWSIMQLLSPIGAKELELLVLLYKGNKWFTYTKTSPGK